MRTRVIDASRLEGGGQIVRIAAVLSALSGTPIRLENIRGNRPRGGGLKGQHLLAIKWLAKACNARVQGLELRSRTLVFEPNAGKVSKKERELLTKPTTLHDGSLALQIIIGLETNGAATLVLQTLLPYLILCPPVPSWAERASVPLVMTLEGGTNVPMSPSIDYFVHVFAPNLSKIGVAAPELLKLQRGYTTGAQSSLGSASILLRPLSRGITIPKICLSEVLSSRNGDDGFESIHIHILAPSPAAINSLRSATLSLIEKYFFPGLLSAVPEVASSSPRVHVFSASSNDAKHRRYFLLLVGIRRDGWRLGADWLYDGQGLKGSSITSTPVIDRVADEMASKVVDELKEAVDTGRVVDRWMEDQLVVFQALAAGIAARHGPRIVQEDLLSEPGPSAHDSDTAAESAAVQVQGTVDADIAQPSGSSLHAVTARWVASELLGVTFDPQTGDCNGIGFAAV